MNRIWHSANGGSLEITSTVPLISERNKQLILNMKHEAARFSKYLELFFPRKTTTQMNLKKRKYISG